MTTTDRRHDILNAAMTLAEELGYQQVTRDAIAVQAGVAQGLVTYYLGDISQIREAIVTHAVDTKNLTVLAQAIVADDPGISFAPSSLRRKAIASFL